MNGRGGWLMKEMNQNNVRLTDVRMIDANKLLRDIEEYHVSDGKFQHWVQIQQTIEPKRKKGQCLLHLLRLHFGFGLYRDHLDLQGYALPGDGR